MRLARLPSLLLLAGCAAAPRPRAAPRVPCTARPAPRVVPSRVARLAALGPVLRVERTREGTERLLVGGARVERHAGSTRVAGELLAAPLVAAVPTRTGWRFATARELYDAPAFLGPLTRVHAVGEGRVGRGAGRVVVLRDGVMDGVAAPAPGPVIDAAFADERRGVAVVEPGLPFATEDGGASWQPVPLRADCGLAAVATGTQRVVLGREGSVVIDAGGRAEEAVPPSWTGEPAPEHGDLAELVAASDPARVLAGASRLGVLDGARVVWVQHPSEGADVAREYDLAADAFVDEATATLPCRVTSLFVADRVYAECAGGPLRLLQRAEPGAWRPWLEALPGEQPPACAASADGARVACAGVCAPAPAEESGALCERVDEGPARTLPFVRGRFLGYLGGEPVALVEDEGGARFAHVGADGAVVPLGAAPAGLGARAGERALRLEGDGRLRTVAVDEAGRLAVLEGRPGSELVAHAAPAGTRALRLGPPRFALAWGAGGVLSQSDDDGASWRSLALVTGDGAPRELLAWGSPQVPRCADAACLLGDDVVRLGWGPLAASRHGARGLPLLEARVAGGPWWRCESTAGVLRVGDVPSLPGPARSYRDVARDGRLVVIESPRARGQQGIEVEALWQRTGAGIHEPLARARFALDRYLAPLAGDPTRWQIVALASREAAAVRCGAGPAGLAPRCDLIALAADGPARVLASFAHGEVRAARAGGGVALLVTPVHAMSDGTPGAPAWLVVAPARGDARVLPVALARDAGPLVGPYVLGDEAGTARALAGGTLVLTPGGGAPHAVTARLTTEACGPEARGEIAFPAGATLALRDAGTREVRLVARYGIAGDALCLRALDGSVAQLGDAGWLGAAPGAGGVVGVAQTREGMAPVRCVHAGGT